MEAGGHTDSHTAMIYQHTVDDRRREMADKLGEHLLVDETPDSIRASISNIDNRIRRLSDERELLLARLRKLELSDS